jgi:hypothetical protein
VARSSQFRSGNRIPSNPPFRQLQKANRSLAGFPPDRAGLIDWIEPLNDGRIEPQVDVTVTDYSPDLDRDIVLRESSRMAP